MLKITTIKKVQRCRLVLEGELVSPWVEELRKEWNNVRALSAGLTLTVDLRNVTTIGQEGRDILLEMTTAGVKFFCHGALNRHVLQQLAREVSK